MPSMTYGAAHQNESGGYHGGKAGDQTQSSTPDYSGEVSLHTSVDSRTFTVYRAINTDYATKMAELMITACNNSHIGYDQDTRDGIWNYGVNTTTNCNCDCSSLVAYCVYKGTGKNLGSFNTSAEPSALEGSGLFTKIGTYSSSMTVYNGDILVCAGHHTLMVVKGNPRSGTDTELTVGVTDSGGAYDSATGSYIAPTNINTSVLNQYVLTIDRNTPNPDYETMLKNRVSGVIIEAGYLYNSQHTVVSNPRNPYIQQQCVNAVAANMPYGLYWDVKARSEDEAKSELYQLQFLIRKYPPVMGIWLHLALTKSKTINNKIIDVYATELEILGLKDFKGFYVTADELEKISWDDYQEDWWLWIVNPLDDMSELDGLLQPYFFTISGEPGSAAANPDYNPGTLVSSGGTSYTGTLTGATNFEQIFNYFSANGYTKQAAAGICGGLGGEAGLTSSGDLKLDSTEVGGLGGVGIGGWSLDYKTAFLSYASAAGEPWPNTSLRVQLNFLIECLDSGNSAVWKFPTGGKYVGKRAWPTQYKCTLAEFKVMTDIDRATGCWTACYEKCYYYNSNISDRQIIARRVYNSYA